MRDLSLIKKINETLKNAGIKNSLQEAYWITAAFDEPYNAVSRRISGEPLQYIFKEWDFYGNDFYVGEGVLIPRPETELLIDTLKEKINEKFQKDIVLYDLCAGTGCVGITAALELLKKHHSNFFIYSIEKYQEAYNFLLKNIKRYNVSNVLTPILADAFLTHTYSDILKPNIILCNPPYLNKKDMNSLQKELTYEPKTALFGGEDGLSYYKKLAFLSYFFKTQEKREILIITEIGENQADSVSLIFYNTFLGNIKISIIKDFAGLNRVLVITI